MKVSLYLFMIMSDDEPTQKNGVVLVVWPQASLRECVEGQHEKSEVANVVRHCLPLRASSFHLCLPNTAATEKVKAVFLTLMGQELRRVVRVHIGELLSVRSFLPSGNSFSRNARNILMLSTRFLTFSIPTSSAHVFRLPIGM